MTTYDGKNPRWFVKKQLLRKLFLFSNMFGSIAGSSGSFHEFSDTVEIYRKREAGKKSHTERNR